MIPAHSFHPMLVHFPIALFLFGVFLEVIAIRKDSTELKVGAQWNMGFGALFSWAAVGTGIAAWLRLGYVLEGTVLYHLIFASTAALLMTFTAIWRKKMEQPTALYWLVLAACTGSLIVAGHLGATLVFG